MRKFFSLRPHRIVDVIRELGLMDAAMYAIERLLRVIARRQCLWKYYLVAQPVPETTLLAPGRARRIRVTLLSPEVLGQTNFDRPAEVIAARLAQGAICFGAFKDDRLIGFQWIALGAFDEDEVRCRFIPEPWGETAWDFDVYVEAVYRAGFVFARMWDEVNAHLRTRGIRWTMSRISAFNSGSIRSHRRLQARVLGSALFLRLGPLQIAGATLAPYFHISLSDRSVPRMRLQPPASAH